MKKLSILLVLILAAMSAYAQPSTITYQGRLFDSSGDPVTQNGVSMTFAIYDASTGGSLLWPTTGTVSKTVDISDGLYSVVLGSGVGEDIAFNTATFSGKTPFLEVTVATTTLPRTEITNVPFSLLSNSATNIVGGAEAAIPYQSAANTTTLLDKGSAGQVLTMNAGATAPEWKTPSNSFADSARIANIANSATSATKLSGGSVGSIPYQSAANTTTLLDKGSAGQVLTMNAGATAPEWKTPSGSANLSGGDAGSIPYQTATSTTAMLAKGANGQVLQLNNGLPVWGDLINTQGEEDPYGYVYELATIADATVVGGADVPLSNNGSLKGITHTTGTTTVTVPEAGYYKINYSVNTTAGIGAAIAVAVNGTVSSLTNIPLLVATGKTVGTAYLSLAAGDVLTLRNNSAIALTMNLAPSVGSQIEVTKITAPSPISNFGYVYDLATIANATVVGGADVPFSNNGQLTGVTHTAGTTTITVSTAGKYKIEFGVSITSGVGSQLGIAVNGTVNATTPQQLLVATGQVTGTAILDLSAGDVLTLRNNSATPLTLALAPSVGTQLNITKMPDVSLSPQFGYTFELATIADATVVGGADVPFSNNGPLTGVTHTAGTTTVTVPETGFYQIDYSANITSGVGSQLALAVNGTVDASTPVLALIAVGQISGSATLGLAAGDVVTLRNNSAVPLTLTLAPAVGAQINLNKIVISSMPSLSADNIKGGAAGSIPYQSATNTTTMLSTGMNGQVLTLSSGIPQWATPSTTATSATTATNLANGAQGSIPYQSAANTTALLAKGATGQVLTMNAGATAPEWKTPSSGGTGAAIIPFASGTPMTMTTVLGGQPGTAGLVSFGSNSSATPVAGIIDLTGGAGVNINQAFIVPSNGTITSLSAFFSSTAALALVGSTVTITAQLYSSITPNNTFSPIPGAVVTFMPPLTGIIAIGTISNGTASSLSIPVAAGTRLLLVYSATVTAGIDISTTISGYGSAGVRIGDQINN